MTDPDERWGRAFARLGRDRRHGASEIARTALAALVLAAPSLAALGGRDRRRQVDRWGRILREVQPAMGAVVGLGDELVLLAHRAPAGELSAGVRSTAQQLLRRIRREPSAIARAARPLFPPHARIVTLSRSSTLHELLTSLEGATIPERVTVLRSLPGGEGAAASRALRAAGLRSEVVEDHLGRSVVADADLVLVGADSLYRDGSIAHKVGTRSLAVAAARWYVPFIVATGLSKLVAGRDRPPRPLPPPFDRTPARRIAEYWTDRGRWTREDVVREASRLAAPRARSASGRGR